MLERFGKVLESLIAKGAKRILVSNIVELAIAPRFSRIAEDVQLS
ncbi:hypothetical protein [Mycoplasma sp. ATU-Cv-508]